MKKFSADDAPTFVARVYPAEVSLLDKLIAEFGYRGRGSWLRGICSGECLVMLTELNTSGAMTTTAKRIRRLLKSLNQSDYEALEQILSGVAAALDRAAVLKSELEQAESAELADDYKDS